MPHCTVCRPGIAGPRVCPGTGVLSGCRVCRWCYLSTQMSCYPGVGGLAASVGRPRPKRTNLCQPFLNSALTRYVQMILLPHSPSLCLSRNGAGSGSLIGVPEIPVQLLLFSLSSSWASRWVGLGNLYTIGVLNGGGIIKLTLVTS